MLHRLRTSNWTSSTLSVQDASAPRYPGGHLDFGNFHPPVLNPPVLSSCILSSSIILMYFILQYYPPVFYPPVLSSCILSSSIILQFYPPPARAWSVALPQLALQTLMTRPPSLAPPTPALGKENWTGEPALLKPGSARIKPLQELSVSFSHRVPFALNSWPVKAGYAIRL